MLINRLPGSVLVTIIDCAKDAFDYDVDNHAPFAEVPNKIVVDVKDTETDVFPYNSLERDPSVHLFVSFDKNVNDLDANNVLIGPVVAEAVDEQHLADPLHRQRGGEA